MHNMYGSNSGDVVYFRMVANIIIIHSVNYHMQQNVILWEFQWFSDTDSQPEIDSIRSLYKCGSMYSTIIKIMLTLVSSHFLQFSCQLWLWVHKQESSLVAVYTVYTHTHTHTQDSN